MPNEGFPGFQHGQFTVEGEIERAAAFAGGANSSPQRQRLARRVLFVVFVLPLAVALLGALL
jgi:hypothetical protein